MSDQATLDALVAAVWAKAQAHEPRSPTLRQHNADWLEQVEVECSTTTYNDRRRKVAKHIDPGLGHLHLEQLDTETIDAFARRLRRRMRATSANSVLAMLRASLGIAVEWKRIDRVPKIRMLPVDEKLPDYLTTEARDRLLEACDDLARPCVALCVLGGLRVGEALALEWRDVRWDEGAHGRLRVRKTKTKKPRVVPMCAALRRELRAAQRIGVQLVVCWPDGSRLSQPTAWRRLKKAADAAEVDTVEGVRLCSGTGQGKAWHVLRHTFASHLVQSGVPLYEVAKLLGHSTTRHTATYAHLAPTQLDDAVAVLDRVHDDLQARGGDG